jgi:predicted O-methyltransferase YrrM
MKTWREITGWFEYPSFYEMCLKAVPENGTLVEIGSWRGRSTCYMGSLIKNSNKNVKFYSVDTWEGSDEEQHISFIEELKSQGKTLFEEFQENIKSCGIDDVVIPIQSTSILAAEQFEDNSLDFVHIDASHEYEDVLNDIKSWYPKVKPGGMITGDDYLWSGVNKAVKEYFKDKTVITPYYDNLGGIVWFHRKKGGSKKMKITLYAIAKNEEKNIEKFLLNAKKFDDVIVVDTGSTDNTIQLLRDAGIKVYEHSQTREEFDFSVARNQALSYVETDWAFSLDFNEDVDEFFPEGFDAIESEFTAFRHLRFDDNGKNEPQQSTESHIRFHRTKNYIWVNAVHEVPTFRPTESYLNEVGVDTTIKITKAIHKTVDKELFYLSLCERELERDSTNTYYLWFVFNHYFATQNSQKAIEYGQEYLNHSKPYFDTFRISVFCRCSFMLFAQQNIKLAANYAFHAVSEAMNLGEPYLSQAFSYLTEISIKLNNPNITIFATGFNPNTLSASERQGAIDKLFLTNLDDIPTAWRGHRKFAEWLVSSVKPEVTVELGVAWGFSTFCFAMPRIGHVYGIDTFEGDQYTGDYSGSYEYVLHRQEKLLMNDNVTFIKGNFDDVVKTWDKKIDILHIDGDHSYEAVKKDYENWSPHLAENGIVLFHDSYVDMLGGRQFGVKRFFEEIDLPKCNFTHTFGLGVVSKNKDLIEFIKTNFDLDNPL